MDTFSSSSSLTPRAAAKLTSKRGRDTSLPEKEDDVKIVDVRLSSSFQSELPSAITSLQTLWSNKWYNDHKKQVDYVVGLLQAAEISLSDADHPFVSVNLTDKECCLKAFIMGMEYYLNQTKQTLQVWYHVYENPQWTNMNQEKLLGRQQVWHTLESTRQVAERVNKRIKSQVRGWKRGHHNANWKYDVKTGASLKIPTTFEESDQQALCEHVKSVNDVLFDPVTGTLWTAAIPAGIHQYSFTICLSVFSMSACPPKVNTYVMTQYHHKTAGSLIWSLCFKNTVF